MARLFPPVLETPEATDGEHRVFSALARHLLPDDEHWVWYEPALRRDKKSATPDFVLLGRPWGLLVLEVKAWSAASVAGGSGTRVRVRERDGTVMPHPHPEHQAERGAHLLMELLRAGGLAQRSGPHEGNPVLPVNHAVVWANCTRGELERLATREDLRIHPDTALTREDLEREDEEGRRRLVAALERVGHVTFPFDLDERLRERVRAVIEPQLRFFDLRSAPAPAEPGPPVPPPGDTPSATTRVPLPALWGHWLDQKQTRMARGLASPRALVYGPAGSGKTEFLVARAQYWLVRKPDSRVLFTCYNASLASHLRHVFALKGTPPDERHLFVRHYHDLCQMILGVPDFHERSREFYDTLEPRVLQELARREDTPTFDLILVDEGQDFSRRMFEVLVRLRASGGEITVVCDPAQDLYGRWSEDNLAPLRDHDVEQLVDCYRNTAPIYALALAVLPAETRALMGLDRLGRTRPEDVGRQGPPPALVALPGLDDLADLVERTVADLDRRGVPLSDLAILYTDREAIPNFAGRLRHSRWRAKGDPAFASVEAADPSEEPAAQGTLRPAEMREEPHDPERAHFARALEEELTARGVPSEWIARDYAAKSAYDISKSRLTISTVHSAKGMDFHTVILLGAEALGVADVRAAELVFTAVTRAREELVIPYFLDRGWIPELRVRLQDLEEDTP